MRRRKFATVFNLPIHDGYQVRQMTPYIAMFLLIEILAILIYCLRVNREKKAKYLWIISLSIITFIAGMRGITVGADTYAYAEIFSYYNSMNWEEALLDERDFEMGFRIYNLVIGVFTSNPRASIFITSAIIFSSLTYFLRKYSASYFMSIFLFLGLNHFFTALNTSRFYLSLAIAIWALPSLLEKRYIRTAILMFSAFSFHRMSIIFSLALILSYYLRRKKEIIVYAFLVSIIAGPLLISRLVGIVGNISSKFHYYLMGFSADNIGLGRMNMIFLFLDVLLILRFVFSKSPQKEESYMMITMFSCLAIIRIIAGYIPRGFRFVQMFDIWTTLIIPLACARIQKNLPAFELLISLVSCVIYIYYLQNDSADILPYIFLG